MIVGRGRELRFVDLPGRRSADPFAGAGAVGLSVRLVRISPDGPRAAHRHPRSPEAVHVVAGEGYAWIDGVSHRVAEGDSFLVPRGAPHATLPIEGLELQLVCFFPDGDLSSNLEELAQSVVDLADVASAEQGGDLAHAGTPRASASHRGPLTEPSRGAQMTAKFLVHEDGDSVGVAVDAIDPGGEIDGYVQGTASRVTVTPVAHVPYGHKIAVTQIPQGSPVTKYGERIGVATADIAVGDHVHTHNLTGERWK